MEFLRFCFVIELILSLEIQFCWVLNFPDFMSQLAYPNKFIFLILWVFFLFLLNLLFIAYIGFFLSQNEQNQEIIKIQETFSGNKILLLSFVIDKLFLDLLPGEKLTEWNNLDHTKFCEYGKWWKKWFNDHFWYQNSLYNLFFFLYT